MNQTENTLTEIKSLIKNDYEKIFERFRNNFKYPIFDIRPCIVNQQQETLGIGLVVDVPVVTIWEYKSIPVKSFAAEELPL